MSSLVQCSGRSQRAQERQQTSAYKMGKSQGKHYSRVVDYRVDFINLFHFGLSMWNQKDNNKPEPDDPDSDYSWECFAKLEKMYNKTRIKDSKTLKEELRNAEAGAEFRVNYCSGLVGGQGQGRSNDLTELKKHLPNLPVFKHTGSTFGWTHGVCLRMLMTQSLLEEGNIAETTNNLKLGIIDTSHSEIYAGLYSDLAIPTDPAKPFHGLMRSELFIAALRIVFMGGSSAPRGSGSGSRGKAFRNGMTALTIRSLGYVAMMLRFPLRNLRKWYTTHNSETDNWFDYHQFYDCLISFLDTPHFEAERLDLFNLLNRAVFPQNHCRQGWRASQHSGRFSMMQVAMDPQLTRAAQQAGSNAINVSNSTDALVVNQQANATPNVENAPDLAGV